MTTIDPTTAIGKVRLRIADWSDIPMLPDVVIQSTLDDNNGNIPAAAKTAARYLLGMLSGKIHRKIGLQLEVFGSEWYTNYRNFLMLTFTNPNFMDLSPIPFNVNGTDLHPLIEFQKNWNLNYAQITQSQQLAWDALGSPSSTDQWVWPS